MRNWSFGIAFVIALTLTLYFLGTSITGLVVQSMHCDQGKCAEFCRYTSDCAGIDEMCCDISGYGVCTYVLDCGKNYVFSIDSDIQSLPTLESPAQVLKTNIAIYVVLLFGILVFGFLYLKGRKHGKKPAKKKR